MDREQAVKYLQSSGFSEEQIKAIEGAFTCDKCVYSTSEGCQYDDITETIPPFDDCISRQAVLDLVDADWKYEGLEELINSLPPVTPQPKTGWIPVSERLPEVGIDVLICDMERNIYLSHRSSFGSYFDDFGNKIKDIRAWMPLPEPYTAEGGEAE